MELIDKVEVPGYSGRGLPVKKGSLIRITDVEGCQVGDLFAIAQDDLDEYLDTGRTREICGRLFPEEGQQFVSNIYNPMLTFLTDNSPGIHDTLYPACDPVLYRLQSGDEEHPSCHQNFLNAAESLGIQTDFVPGPVNLFQNTPVIDDGKLSQGPALSKPGDNVELMSEMDLILILTSCSYDIDPEFICGKSTPLLIEVFRRDSD
jgi:uncharacterized protein YcgI (DUF1989 family)